MKLRKPGVNLLCVALAAALAAGCAQESPLELEQLALLPSEEDSIEFPLGDFCIPIPEEPAPGGSATRRRNSMELEFSLSAEICTDNETRLAEVFAMREGAFRDCVIRVCRNATAEDLSEPELATLKMRLQGAVDPILGRNVVRKLVFLSLRMHEV